MTEPAWMAIARRHVGVAEVPGKATAPTIARWLRELRAWWSDDETPWCGVFVAAVLRDAKLPVAKNWFRARAWLDWGVPIREPAPGCVVVFNRAGGGHVAFAVGRDVLGRLVALGGNQGNRVSIAPFDPLRVLGYRWPEAHFAELAEAGELPLVDASGIPTSTQEA